MISSIKKNSIIETEYTEICQSGISIGQNVPKFTDDEIRSINSLLNAALNEAISDFNTLSDVNGCKALMLGSGQVLFCNETEVESVRSKIPHAYFGDGDDDVEIQVLKLYETHGLENRLGVCEIFALKLSQSISYYQNALDKKYLLGLTSIAAGFGFVALGLYINERF